MSKEKDKWSKSWKERLGDYQEPAPADLWAELERELNTPRVIPFYRRYAAVAAIASIVVLSGVAVWWLNTSSSDYVRQVSETVAAVAPLEEDKVPTSQEKTVITPDRIPEPVAVRLAKAEPVEAMMLMTPQAVPEEKQEMAIKEEPADEQKTAEAVEEKSPRTVRKGGYTYDFSSTDTRRQTSKHKSQNRWAVGVSVGNAPIGTSSQGVGYKNLSQERGLMQIMPNEMMAASAYTQLVSHNLDNTVHSKTKHKMPVTVGVSVRWHLNDRWALESGLTYTKLSSELWSGSESDFYESDQKLHYVGIPVKASYKLWENKLFAFYVSAGGAVEKCVSGKVNTTYTVNGLVEGQEQEDLKVKELQWSTSAAVGAQVKLTPHLGLYVEPSLSYYFKDGSSIETIRKEHPLNFNLQTGLRLTY